MYNEGVSRYKPLLTTQPTAPPPPKMNERTRARLFYAVEDLNFRERMCVVNRRGEVAEILKFMKSRLSARRQFLSRTLREFKFRNFGGGQLLEGASRFTTLAIRLFGIWI